MLTKWVFEPLPAAAASAATAAAAGGGGCSGGGGGGGGSGSSAVASGGCSVSVSAELVWFKDTWLKKQIVTNTLDELNSCYEVFLPTINRRLAALDPNPDPDPDPNPVPIPNPSRSAAPRSVLTTPSLPPLWLLIAAIALAFAYAATWWRQSPNPYSPMKPDPNPLHKPIPNPHPMVRDPNPNHSPHPHPRPHQVATRRGSCPYVPRGIPPLCRVRGIPPLCRGLVTYRPDRRAALG